MAANSAVSTDDLIVHLMSMGFDLSDCQDAIGFGKTSVEAAVEWLIAGKPGFKQHSNIEQEGPSLKLRQQTSTFNSTSSAFSKPVPIREQTASDVAVTTSTATPISGAVSQSESMEQSMDQSEIVSRHHLSENQRKQKESFEHKKRDEAKKKAVAEKKRQKEDHARVLKDIAADREKKKMLQASRDNVELEAGSPVKEPKIETAPIPSQSLTSLLQIRLPDGRCLRESFNSTARLQDVWEFIQKRDLPNLTDFILMQPFPHHEFTDREMLATLEDLKLTPSGSLVLKKKQVKPNTQETGMDLEDAIPIPPGRPLSGGPTYVPPSPPVQGQPQNSYNWGQGHGMSDGNPPANEDSEEMDEEENEVEPNVVIPGNQADGVIGLVNQQAGGIGFGNQAGGGINFPPGFGGGGINLPPAGNIMGQPNDIFGMQVGAGQQMFGGVGQRLVAHDDNQPAPEEAHGLRLARERAFQRAEARQPQVQQQNEPGPSHQPQHSSFVQKLTTSCLKHITHRLNDPRQTILSLGGVPEDMAQFILNYLIKEKQLKPKTLKPFVPCYLRQLILDAYPYATNELIRSIRLHKNLSHLSLSSCPLITDDGFQCLSVLKKLKQLNLSGCKQITNKCSSVLCSLSNLVSLNLEDTGFSDPGVIKYLSSNPANLTHLNLNRTGVSHAVLSHLQSGAKQIKQLSLEDTQVESLSDIDQLNCLESLNIGRTNVVPESLLCLVKCPALTTLNIANTDKINGNRALENLEGLKLQTLGLPSRLTTTDTGIHSLIAFKLHSLDLTNYIYVTDKGIQHVGQIRSLRKLLLGNTKLTDTGMVFLEGLTNLEILHLDRTKITDTGAAIVKGFTKLTELSMASTDITSRLLTSQALNTCTSLTKVNLSKTVVTSRGILALSLPCLEMLNLDGTRVGPDLTVAMVTRCPVLSQMTLRNLVPFTRDDEVEEAEMEVDN